MAIASPNAPAAQTEPQPKKKQTLRNGLIILAVAVALGVGLLVAGLTAMPDVGQFPRATSDGEAVELQAGNWTVFAEGSGAAPIQILGPDQQVISISESRVNSNYNYGGRRGYSVGNITIPETGSYTVTNGPGGTTAFAQNFAGDLTKAILLIVAGSLVGLSLGGLGLVLTVLGLSHRRNAAAAI